MSCCQLRVKADIRDNLRQVRLGPEVDDETELLGIPKADDKAELLR